MPKRHVGHKANSALNGEWASHVRGFMKKLTSSLRRTESREIIREELEDPEFYRTKKQTKEKKYWIREYKLLGSPVWHQDGWGKYAASTDALQSIKGCLHNSYHRRTLTLRDWRVRNIKTGEIIESKSHEES